MLAQKNKDIEKAVHILEVLSKDEKARMAYEAREAQIKDDMTRMKMARKEGKKEGKKESKIEDILGFLEEVGIVSEELKLRISKEEDLEKLSKWMRIAARVDKVEEFVEKM